MVLGVLIGSFLIFQDMGTIENICFSVFLCPGFFVALPIMTMLDVPFGPCSEGAIFPYVFVCSFIFYTLLIFGILKLWYRFKKFKAQKNYNWRAWFE
jgi:hypothetical protein